MRFSRKAVRFIGIPAIITVTHITSICAFIHLGAEQQPARVEMNIDNYLFFARIILD